MDEATLSAVGGSVRRIPAVVAAPSGFELLEEVGRGGMGIVYRARDTALDREVAVKLLRETYAVDSSTAVRFLNEARITGQLQHPGIPAVYQVGTRPDGRPFLAMKLIKGQTLEALLKAGSPVDPLAVIEAISQAVGYAHARGVIHRDLKPSNIMVGAFGEVQVMDWGLAKVLASAEEAPTLPANDDPNLTTGETVIRSKRDSGGSFTQAGSLLGTPAFMPPEQAAGELAKIDTRSDVFGLGAILCVLLTGKPPFAGDTIDTVRLNAVRGKTEEAFARLDASGADPGVVALCKRCLAFEPAQRPATGDEVAAAVAALRCAADERARQAERERLATQLRAAEQATRWRVIQWAAVAVIVVLAGGVAVSVWQARRASDEAVRADNERSVADRRRAEADEARSDADAKRKDAEQAYGLARESLVQVGAELPDVLRQAIYTREAQVRANRVLADALAKQLDPTAVHGLTGRAKMALHIRAGDVQAELGKRGEAEAHYKAALAVSTQLLEAGGDEAALAKGNHALVLAKLAVAERDKRRTVDAARQALVKLAEVEKLQRELLAAPPPDRTLPELRQSVAGTLLERATTYRMLQQYDQALEPCREAIALIRPRADDPPANRYTRDRKSRLAGAVAQLASIHLARQDDAAAEDALKEAAALTADVLKDDPRNAVSRLAAARAARELGDFLLMRNHLDDADKYYAKDIAAFRDLLNTGELLALRFELGDAYYRTATLALKRKDKKKAAEQYARCRSLWQEVAEGSPSNRNKLAVALVQARLGEHEAGSVFPRKLLDSRNYSLGDGIQAVCVLALCGGASEGSGRRAYFDDALAGLTRLVDELGYKNVARLKTDPDLDPLRAEPAFQVLIKKLDAELAKRK